LTQTFRSAAGTERTVESRSSRGQTEQGGLPNGGRKCGTGGYPAILMVKVFEKGKMWPECGEIPVGCVRWEEPGSRAAGCERRAPLRSSPIAGGRNWTLITLVACLAVIFGAPALAASDGMLSIAVSTRTPALGDPVVVEVAASGGVDNLVLRWKGAAWPMREVAPGRYEGLIGVDIDDPVGPAVVAAEGFFGGARVRAEAEVTISPRKFALQEMTLPKGMAEFDKATLARIEAEAAELSRRFSLVTTPRWRTPFLPPVEEYRPENFGARRVINGDPRMPHSAVDIRLPGGTPVRAIADGRIAFAGEQFFGGRSVVIDHGGGVFSVYYHLKEFSVAEGQGITRGERIGSVGATGRATGPHLHFGVRVPGGRIDPTGLFALPGR